MGEEISIQPESKHVSSVSWTVLKNDLPAALSDVLEGELTAKGGTIRFKDTGSFTLTATAKNSRGRTVTHEQTLSVYPVITAAFTLPETAHTDTSVPVELTAEHIGANQVVWSLTQDGKAVTLSDVLDGELDKSGGTVLFREKGAYTLTASITDERGKIITASDSLTVYPVAEVKLTLPAMTHTDMVSLMIQQLYREILAVADENGGKLKNRVMFYCDELGTLPAIESLELIFSASRSRRLSMVPIIQSFGQLEKNYGKEGSEIIIDNCQDTIFGGFAPNSQTAEVLSKALGSRTVMSGSVSRGKNDPSQSLQMMERPLMTPDELKSIPKGSFIVMKTGTHPMRTKLRLFLDWGISFGKPYTVEEKIYRKVSYADKQTLEENIVRKHMPKVVGDEEAEEPSEPTAGTGTLHTPVVESAENAMRRRSVLKT